MFDPELLSNPAEDLTSARARRELKVPCLAIPLIPPPPPTWGPTSCRTKTKQILLLFPLRIILPWVFNATEVFSMEIHLGMSTFQSLLSVSKPMGKPEVDKRRKDLLLPHSTASSSPPTSAHASSLISPSSPAPAVGAAQIPVLSRA